MTWNEWRDEAERWNRERDDDDDDGFVDGFYEEALEFLQDPRWIELLESEACEVVFSLPIQPPPRYLRALRAGLPRARSTAK